MILTGVLALAAAFSNAVNVMTQHSASVAAPKREKGWRLVAYLFRQPLWLLGWIAAVGGFVLQALALHHGRLSVVQPILVTELVFVLVLRRVWIRQDVARAAWRAVLVACVGLGVFLAAAEPTGGHPNADTAKWLSALLAFGAAIALLAAAGMRGSPVRRTSSFSAAGALAWAPMATFIKSTTETLAMFGIPATPPPRPCHPPPAPHPVAPARRGTDAKGRRGADRCPPGGAGGPGPSGLLSRASRAGCGSQSRLAAAIRAGIPSSPSISHAAAISSARRTACVMLPCSRRSTMATPRSSAMFSRSQLSQPAARPARSDSTTAAAMPLYTTLRTSLPVAAA